jgi:hypothetical protein
VIEIPLSTVVAIADSPEAFAVRIQAHCAALEAHRMGKPGVPAPMEHELVDSLILRIPDSGPVAQRGPDQFVVAGYEILDDTPVDPAVQHALDTLRETISG